MSAEVPQTDGGSGDEELADKHDGATVERDQMQGSFEYTVQLTEEQIDELPDGMKPEEFAGNLATSRINSELNPKFTIRSSDAFVKETTSWAMDVTREFTVLIRFEQSD